MKRTNYYILIETIGANYNTIGSEVLAVYQSKADAIEWAKAYIEDQKQIDGWHKPTIKQESATEWQINYNGRHATTVKVKSTTMSADQIESKYNIQPSKKDLEALHDKLYGKSITPIINNQNQTTMATKQSQAKKFTSVPFTGARSKKNGNRVQGNPYQLKNNNVIYQAVPEKMVTLPKGNHFIVAKKHVNLASKGGFSNQATYVLGYSNLEGKRSSGKTRRMYFVARLIWRGGNPALALYRYMGYDYQLAKEVFSEIAYDSAEYLARDGQFKSYRVKSMDAKAIVAAKLKKQKALEKMKTAAYGNKAARQAYAKAHKNSYFRTK